MATEDRDRLVRVETLIEGMDEKLESLTKAIRGNGQPGLLDRVTHMETMLTEHLDAHSGAPARRDNIIQIIGVVIMVIIAGVGWLG
jgi:hypothetical protein